MAEPITINNAVKDASEAIAALKRVRPRSDVEARTLCAELLKANQLFVDASKAAIDTSVEARIANAKRAPVAGEATSLSNEVVAALAAGLVPFLGEFVAEALSPLKERLDTLEARPLLEDAGVWDEKTAYPPGRVVTHDGSAWVSRQLNSRAKPGTSGVWRLLVSRGRNGRDAKGSR